MKDPGVGHEQYQRKSILAEQTVTSLLENEMDPWIRPLCTEFSFVLCMYADTDTSSTHTSAVWMWKLHTASLGDFPCADRISAITALIYEKLCKLHFNVDFLFNLSLMVENNRPDI